MDLPNDDNGDALRRLQRDGHPLTAPRDIDFSVVFPQDDVAESFAAYFRALGYSASLRKSEAKESFPWDVTVVKHMVPAHAEITEFEAYLEDVATNFGGVIDGWGCFALPTVS